MSRVTRRREALVEIAALVGSGRPVSEFAEKMLESISAAVGAECVALAVREGTAPPHVWASGKSDWISICSKAAENACIGRSTQISGDVLVREIDRWHDGKAVLAFLPPIEDSFVDLAAGYVLLAESAERSRKLLAESEAQSSKRIAELAAVYEIGQAVNELDTDRLLRLITEKAASVMDAQACSLLLRDIESDCLTIVASWGLDDDIVRGTKVSMGEGIAGKVAATGEAMLLLDVENDPRLSGASIRARSDVAASICAPLKDESGRVIGVLNIRRHVPAPPFTDEDFKLFCVFASQAALAISNAKLYTDLSNRIAEMSTVSDLMRTINSTLDLDYVLDQIADSIVNVVGFSRCCVYLADPRSGELEVSVYRGYEKGELTEKIPVGQGAIGLAAKEQIPIFAVDEKSLGSGLGRSERQTSFLATPIVVRNQCIGVVVVDNSIKGKPINAPEVELLSTFVNQAGVAIENARLYEAMEEKYSELNVLFEHSRTLSSAYGLENVAHIAAAVARKAVSCDGCILLMLGERRTSVALQVTAGITQRKADELRELLGRELAVEFVRELRTAATVTKDSLANYSGSAQRVLKLLVGEKGAALIVPLVAEDATIGAFVLVRGDGPPFMTGELQLISIVASQVAVTLKNAMRYEQRMRRQVLDLSTLYEFSRRISSSSSLEEALDAILGVVHDLVDCDESVIYAIDHSRNVLVATAKRVGGAKAKISEPERRIDDDSVESWTVRERKAVVSPDAAEDTRFSTITSGGRVVRSLMSIPLMVQDEVVGVLCVRSFSPNLYSEDDVRVLSIIASQSAAIYKELEALAALTSYTDNILASIAAGVVALSSEGVVLTWNRAAEEITGISADDVVGRTYKDVISMLNIMEEDKLATSQILDKVRSTGKTYQGYKVCYHLPDGSRVYINMSASVLSNSAGESLGLVIVFEDITKEIKMEDEFRRMGELAAVGQLAASIAHELRNPLSSIKGAAQFLQKEYETDSAISEFLDIIIDEVNGLSKLTTEFLEFARPVEIEPAPVDMNEVVRRTLQFMSVHIGESGVLVEEQLDLSLPIIEADEKQVEQVLRNCILNAIQAMPNGGKLTVGTGTAGEMVSVFVEDTGVGISEENLSRIFVPFFTTKTKGTGLGLAVVQKIVENHGGHIEVSSCVGKGTRFTIMLPINGSVRRVMSEADITERRS